MYAGPNAFREHAAKSAVILRDSLDRDLYRLLCPLPRSLCRGGGAPIATSKAHCAGQFCRERFYLVLDLGCAVDSTELLGLIQFLAKFGKPYPIGGFSLFIQNFPRIAQATYMNPCRF
jgi:hypothetical protein